MVTAAQRIEQAAAPAVQMHPEARIHIGRDKLPCPAALAELVIQGGNIKGDADAAKGLLEEVNVRLLPLAMQHMYEAGTLHIVADGVKCTIKLTDAVAISNEAALREHLGARFSDLVEEKLVCKPTKKLVDMALDADAPDSAALRACLTVQTGKASISYGAA